MTNRYSRTGTALADGISGTRVMQPANNAVIQAPALSVSPVQIALRIKKPLWKSGAHSCRNLSCVRRRFNRKNKPGGIKRGRSFPKASSAGKKRSAPLGQGLAYGFMEQEDLEACKAELSISTASQNTPTAIRPKTQAPATEECSLPASAAPPLPCIDEPAPAARRRRNLGKCPTFLPGRAVFWHTGRTSSSRDAETAPAALRKGLMACTS